MHGLPSDIIIIFNAWQSEYQTSTREKYSICTAMFWRILFVWSLRIAIAEFETDIWSCLSEAYQVMSPVRINWNHNYFSEWDSHHMYIILSSIWNWENVAICTINLIKLILAKRNIAAHRGDRGDCYLIELNCVDYIAIVNHACFLKIQSLV